MKMADTTNPLPAALVFDKPVYKTFVWSVLTADYHYRNVVYRYVGMNHDDKHVYRPDKRTARGVSFG